jgi:Fructose-1,6-bisphosphatase/sedoheptulose 1,7-bisphosphatase and related proteins
LGIDDFNKKYFLNEIITGDSIFCATGITSGELVSGIKIENNTIITDTLITHKSNGLTKNVLTNHKINAA